MLNHGADMAELPEKDFSSDLNKVMQVCLSKNTWDRPVASKLAEYAAMKVKGQNPQPLWPEEVVKEPVKVETPQKVNNNVAARSEKRSVASWFIVAALGLASGVAAALFTSGIF